MNNQDELKVAGYYTLPPLDVAVALVGKDILQG